MKVCNMEYAKRIALQCFDEWLDITGLVPRCSSYYSELEGIIEDAVEIGAMVALGVQFEIVDGRPKPKAERGVPDQVELHAIRKVHKMCEESCSPEQFESWREIQDYLMETRKNLQAAQPARAADGFAAADASRWAILEVEGKEGAAHSIVRMKRVSAALGC